MDKPLSAICIVPDGGTFWRWETATWLAYRLAAYAVFNLGEDAAMVAFMFC